MPALTLGMAVVNDWWGVWPTLESLQVYHADVLPELEIVVVDNAPHTPHGAATKQLCANTPNCRYVPMPEPQGTSAPRHRVFQEATADAVLCVDSHVLLWPGTLRRLIRYFADNPGCRDLLQGPYMHDFAGAVMATHMLPRFGTDGMFGVWFVEESHRGPLSCPPLKHVGDDLYRPCWPEMQPFEIPMHGLGLFSCRRDAWVGFHDACRGFGGEEGPTHEKFRQRGDRTLCLPWLRWSHRCQQAGIRGGYVATVDDHFHNALTLWQSVGWDVREVRENYRARLPEAVLERIWNEVDARENFSRVEIRGDRTGATLAPRLAANGWRQRITIHGTERPACEGDGGLWQAIAAFVKPEHGRWEIVEPNHEGDGCITLLRHEDDDPRRLQASVRKVFGPECPCTGRQNWLNRWFAFEGAA